MWCFSSASFFDTGWRCHPDLNWGVELLQSSALPLGYGTAYFIVRSFGERKNRLLGKNGAKKLCPVLERVTRLELATSTLARWRSTR